MTPKMFGCPFWLGLLILLGTAAYFLWAEHRAHLLGLLPLALILLCPLLHLFMHKGHGHGHDHGDSEGKESRPEKEERP